MGEVDVSRSERSFVGTGDPFATLPLLYFLPESVKTLELPASGSDPDDVEALHEFLKSKIRVSNISKQLPLQANRIVNNAKESLKDATARQPLRETDMNHLSITKCIKHTVAEGKENGYDLQKRRPGFDRKRARFSLKPISHDVMVTSTRPNLDQLKDPEECFAAYERQENAEKELKRLMGGNLVDQSSSHCLAESRTRRQGILGKRATYRHSYTAIAVDASKHTSAVEKSEAGNNSVPSPRNGDSSSASMSVHGIGMNQGMANDISVLNENLKGTAIGALLESINFGSLLDAYCNPDEGQQKSLKMQEIDMHKIQFPKFKRFSLHEILSPQASTSKAENRLESDIFNFADQTWNSKISEETPKTYAVPEITHSPMTSPTPPKSPFAAISSFCRNKSQKMSEKDTSHSPLLFDLMKESSFATRFEVEVPSHPGSILQQDRSVILCDSPSKNVDKSGSLPSGLSRSKWLEKDSMGPRLDSVTTQADGLAGPEGQGQEKNMIVGSSYKIECSSISQLPGQEACSTNKNPSSFETVGIACPSDQVSGKNSSSESSIMKQSTSGGTIQYPTSEECKAVGSSNCEDLLRDGLACSAGVELGMDSNGSDKDVNPQVSMSSDCMEDKNSDIGNSTEIQSTSGIQHLALEECDFVNNNDYVNMSNDGLTCSAGEGLGENSKGFSKDVNPQTGVPSICTKDSMGTRLNSVTTQAGGLAGPEGQGQDTNMIVGSPYKIESSSISQLPEQEACGINKNPSGFETVGSACPSNQVLGKNSSLENSIMKQSTSGGTIQYPTNEECKAVSSNNCEDVLRDGLAIAGVELGKDSNGSDKDVNPQIAMSSDCMKDKNTDLGNSTEIQSTSGIQHLALEECDAVNNNDYVNMPNDGLTCSAGEGLGENSKGFSKDVNPQTGVPSICIKYSFQATVDPASTAQEAVDGDKDQTSPPTGACRAQEQHLNETNVSSNPQNETSEAPSKALGWKRSKKMASDHRKSLLGAGTAWESGVRRSTRIRSRPLEYWKGERFLYGRVHNSLVTVIGVKYSSPVDDSKKQTTLKVKSFVSDEYSHLLDLAGSH